MWWWAIELHDKSYHQYQTHTHIHTCPKDARLYFELCLLSDVFNGSIFEWSLRWGFSNWTDFFHFYFLSSYYYYYYFLLLSQSDSTNSQISFPRKRERERYWEPSFFLLSSFFNLSFSLKWTQMYSRRNLQYTNFQLVVPLMQARHIFGSICVYVYICDVNLLFFFFFLCFFRRLHLPSYSRLFFTWE